MPWGSNDVVRAGTTGKSDLYRGRTPWGHWERESVRGLFTSQCWLLPLGGTKLKNF